jgi:hypothetical protein
MQNTTIQVSLKTRDLLDSAKKYRRETYNDVLNRVLEEAGYVRKWVGKGKEKTLTSALEKNNTKNLQEIEY